MLTPILIILYLFSMLGSSAILYEDFYKKKNEGYKHSWWESITGLLIIPLIPVVNIGIAYVVYKEIIAS